MHQKVEHHYIKHQFWYSYGVLMLAAILIGYLFIQADDLDRTLFSGSILQNQPLIVQAPNQAKELKAGEPMVIQWTKPSTANGETYELILKPHHENKGTANRLARTITNGLPANTTQFEWKKTPAFLRGDFKVEVRLGDKWDISDEYFSFNE